ncbi:MAG: MlaD family protein [Planctomycetota bacterium]|jgi:ABC-type transporter Mla subunit MlaD
MTAADRGANNVKAGLFVVLSLVGMFLVVVFLSDSVKSMLRSQRSYTVFFDIEGGVKNLQPGGDVRLGGVAVGSVETVRLVQISPADAARLAGRSGNGDLKPVAPAYAVEVGFSLDERYVLHRDALLSISAPLVGSEVWIDVTSLGGLEPILTEETPLLVRTGSGLVGQLLGPDAGRTIEDILADVREMTMTINGRGDAAAGFRLDEALAGVTRIIDDGQDAAASVRAMVAEVRTEHLPQWTPRIESILDRVDRAALRGEEAVGEVRELVARVDGAVERNESRVDGILADAEAIAESMRTTTLPELDARLAEAGPVLQSTGRSLDAAERMLSAAEADVLVTMSNIRLASQQASLLVEELRRSPWKALYRPQPGELENELLYETARGLALAADRLESATARATRLMDEAGPVLAEDPELLERIRATLGEPLRTYEQAQQRLLEVLVQRTRTADGDPSP